MLRFQRRKKLHCLYADELGVLTPLNQRFEHFVENYDCGDKRRAGKMTRQTRMVGADYTANLEDHSRRVAALDHAIERAACFCCAPAECQKPNRWQYGAKAWSTSATEKPNCDKSYRWLADNLLAWLATRERMRCSASRDSDQPKYS
jgi:hypothetical protein